MIVTNQSVVKSTGKTVNITYDAIEKCTNCNKALSPQKLYSIVIEKEDEFYIYVADFCNSCKTVLISEYKANKISDNVYRQEKLIRTYPEMFESEYFEKDIEKLSPQFVKIYNQALQAEKIGLDEIAGLGYRKAVEFLIKDFAIHERPNEEDEIRNSWMKVCIEKYIEDKKIQVLAEKSDWIGNDEAHYIRKQEDRDIKDMKRFIKAMVYYIGIILITEDAENMKK